MIDIVIELVTFASGEVYSVQKVDELHLILAPTQFITSLNKSK